MKAFNKRKRPKHFTKGRVIESNGFLYVNHKSIKKISYEHYKSNCWCMVRYNLVRIVRKHDMSFKDGNWISAKESREWNAMYSNYCKIVATSRLDSK